MAEQPGCTLRDYRFRQRLSQYSIQVRAGVHQSRLSLIENGLIQPTEKEKMAIAKVFGVDPEDIAWPTMLSLKRYSNQIHNDGEKNV